MINNRSRAGLSAAALLLSWAVSAPAQTAAKLAYQNAPSGPPPGWTGPVFQLSHNYPASNPGVCDPTVCTWLAVNAEIQQRLAQGPGTEPVKWDSVWLDYIQKIKTYVQQGQDAQLADNNGWKVEVGGRTRWFHVPWMAFDPTRGREFVHGLTNERTAVLSDFGPRGKRGNGLNKLMLSSSAETQKSFETWAFGVYNEWGGYAFGRTWTKSGDPVVNNVNGMPQPAGLPFPEGTVVAKLLFTTATAADVPYLRGSPDWQADRHVEKDNEFFCERKVDHVFLVQMDVAVVDLRSPSRWVFGTFAYDGKLTGNVWDRMVPVGLQWGNDPWTYPAVPAKTGPDLVPVLQSVLNKEIGTPQHFGCNGRLAGPVDNKESSCMACHGGGFAPPAGLTAVGANTPPIFGFPGLCTNYSVQNAQYFANGQFPNGYTGGQFPNLLNMDTSLQMQVAFLQYGQFKQFGKPAACPMKPKP